MRLGLALIVVVTNAAGFVSASYTHYGLMHRGPGPRTINRQNCQADRDDDQRKARKNRHGQSGQQHGVADYLSKAAPRVKTRGV